MENEKGTLSVSSENILPIIKKWLYTDKDIFIRELISNGCDAVTKLQNLARMGETTLAEDEKYSVRVILDAKEKTLQFVDNGIGMDAAEIKEYINQIAFSGAQDFVTRYEEKMTGDNEIIGHFGLGFYSAFMVAGKVTIDTCSYKEGASAVKWVSDGGVDFELTDGTRTERGTTITLYMAQDSEEFLKDYTVRSTIQKYCAFMPVEIFFTVVEEEVPSEKDDVLEEGEDADIVDGDDNKEAVETPINEPNPLWMRQPKDCTDEDYKTFYRVNFMDFNEPLFWIHLNMDYPFKLKGILYFPKLKSDMELIEGQVKLFSNQVYVADNVKEVIPEFLLLLKGVMDCPDIPLNVSRSALQNDGYAAKMSSYIIKKVGDKLNSVYKKERKEYEGFWDDISIFIKYGCIKEQKFYDKVKEILLFKTTANAYVTLKEYQDQGGEKTPNKVYYVNNENQQAQYIKLFQENGMEAVILPTPIDTPFIQHLEMNDNTVKFVRIDSDLSDIIASNEVAEDVKKEQEQQQAKLEGLFRENLNNDKLIIKTENLNTDAVSGLIVLDEQAMRLEEMQKMFGGAAGMPAMDKQETLTLNNNHALIQLLLESMEDADKKEDVKLICEQVYDLALMGQTQLPPDKMNQFIERSNLILQKVAKLR